MPKRVLDFDALWASDKLAACADWAQAEYAWLYGLADASGSFEMTNLRVIWGRVAAVRRNLTLERLQQIFDEFIARGLLFTWEDNGKRYGHWTGSDVPGRLPPPSWRARLERLAPPVPRPALAAYTARFGARRSASPQGDAVACVPGDGAQGRLLFSPLERSLKAGLEDAQAQDWNSDWDKEREETPAGASVSPAGFSSRETRSGEAAAAMHETAPPETEQEADASREQMPLHMLAIYEAERGGLPAAERWTQERRRRCAQRLAAGLTLEDFRAAVRRAARTPFLTGTGDRGWRANFDWFIANDTNVRKVLEGLYDAHHSEPSYGSHARVGAGPVAQACGARVKPATLDRIRAREAARALQHGARAGPANAAPTGGESPGRADRNGAERRDAVAERAS